MRPAGLRARVAAAAAVAIAVAVVLLGVAILAVLGHELRGSLDRALRSRAVDVARLAASTPDLLVAPGALEGRQGAARPGRRPPRTHRRPLGRARRPRAARGRRSTLGAAGPHAGLRRRRARRRRDPGI